MADQADAMACAHEGLRQRKLRQTREHVEQVTVELVDRLGYDQVSVEMICDQAEISPRTFYNYFGTKDAAILGYIPASIDAAALQQFIEHSNDDIIDALLQLIASAEHSPLRQSSLQVQRHRILHEHPHLLTEIASRVERLQSRLNDAIAERVALELGTATTDARVQQRARLLFAVVIAVVKIALVTGPEQLPPDMQASETAVLERLRRARGLAVDMLG
ncbi:TetR/AcrR family transcriptional regulator [Pseudoclavibacter sp. 13-3]|uniref:TetR/AcrR family transcriptional regulator n=1 Tax=Pseudoclavibacter sp. 13-3 TaxID=2901228 RepID=UPI001E42CB9E|nr:TetR/AcrR family transcriptional regulator [Pseudoclavibacter sp. 13-3]MCD7101107.1 TetR/AcrR family transcriptional regulator [Pseudoclavibacter sp. 13-3]